VKGASKRLDWQAGIKVMQHQRNAWQLGCVLPANKQTRLYKTATCGRQAINE